MYLDEAEQPMYEPNREAWTGWANLTSMLWAVAAVSIAFAAASWWVQTQLNIQQQLRYWAEYQGLAGKIENLRLSQNIFNLYQLQEQKSPNLKKFVEETLKNGEKELSGLEQEWEHLEEASAKLEDQGNLAPRRAAGLARTAFVFLVAMALAAAGGLGKKKLLWLMSLILGVAGGASFLGAIFLWF